MTCLFYTRLKLQCQLEQILHYNSRSYYFYDWCKSSSDRKFEVERFQIRIYENIWSINQYFQWYKCTNTYTVLHMFRQVLFGAGNQGNHQNFEKSLLTNKLWHVFMGMKQKKSKWPTRKNQSILLTKGPIHEIFAIFASFSWKHVKVYRIARIFRNFDDYPGFKPKTTPA